MTRNGMIVNNEVLTASVLPEVQQAIDGWLESHTPDLDVILEPYGLTVGDIAHVQFREIVAA